MTSASAAIGKHGVVPGLLDRPSFDVLLILSTVILAMTAGTTAWLVPALFMPILFADLWAFGYHHVIATYTPLCFDRQSRRDHQFLLYVLPVLVLGAVLVMVWLLGLWSVPTLYLYWQWSTMRANPMAWRRSIAAKG